MWLPLPDPISGSQGLLFLFEGVDEPNPALEASSGSTNTTRELEVEAKFVFDKGSTFPDLSQVAPLGAVTVSALNALYFDTPDLDLQNLGVTLRRRSGGSDSGWHLKVKSEVDGERVELHAPIAGARPPGSLRSALPESVRMSPLIPVARLETKRTETPLLSPRGTVLATVCEDEVRADTSPDSASNQSGPAAVSWREVEVELGSGDRRVLTHLSRVLASSGISGAPYGSKISRALEHWPSHVGAKQEIGATQRAIRSYVFVQVGMIQALEEGVRLGSRDAIHRSRVAARRLRSALVTFPLLYPKALRAHLEDELRWYGGVLSDLRDVQVLMERLSQERSDRTIEEQSEADSVLGLLEQVEASTLEVAWQELSSPRFELLHDLLVLLVDPRANRTEGDLAAHVEDAVLRTGVAKPIGQAYSRFLVALEAETDSDPITRALRWHAVRKASKSVRYAYEAILGEDAKASTAWQEATSELGALQDVVFTIESLRDLSKESVSQEKDGLGSGLATTLLKIARQQEERLTGQVLSAQSAFLAAISLSVDPPCE